MARKKNSKFQERALKIIACGESNSGHRWHGCLDDGAYAFCEKCGAHTDRGSPLVFLSMFDRVNGASQALTLSEGTRRKLCESRGLTYPKEKVEPYG